MSDLKQVIDQTSSQCLWIIRKPIQSTSPTVLDQGQGFQSYTLRIMKFGPPLRRLCDRLRG